MKLHLFSQSQLTFAVADKTLGIQSQEHRECVRERQLRSIARERERWMDEKQKVRGEDTGMRENSESNSEGEYRAPEGDGKRETQSVS